MRKLILIEFLTLNGVIQGPGGPEEDTSGGFKYGGWIVPYSDEVLGKVIREQMKEPFNLLIGRKTYDNWAAYWPHHESNWPGINAATKYVASRTPSLKLDWENSILMTGDIVREIKDLKEQDGLDLHVYGSGDLIQTLLKHDLVDELRLKIFPITLGAGKSLFAEGTIPAAFKLIDSSISSKGVIIARYERAGDIKTGSF
jgi:dihydrofolate reductase